jgi:hypothetical protein
MKRTAMKQSKQIRACVIVTLFAFILPAACQNPADRQRLVKLHEIASETPLYPDFKPIAESEGAKSTIADVTVSYRSSANFEDVKQFYVQKLTRKGWEMPEANQFGGYNSDDVLIFRKGEYEITVAYKDERYYVSHVWGNP